MVLYGCRCHSNRSDFVISLILKNNQNILEVWELAMRSTMETRETEESDVTLRLTLGCLTWNKCEDPADPREP